MAHHTRNPGEPGILIVCFTNDSASAPRNLGAKDQAKGARGSGAELLGHLELREKRAKTRPKSPKRQKGHKKAKISRVKSVECWNTWRVSVATIIFCGGCWGHTFLVFDWMKFHPSLPTIFLCPFQDSIPFSFMFCLSLIPGSWMTSLTLNEIPVAWFLSDITFLGVGYAEPWIRVP